MRFLVVLIIFLFSLAFVTIFDIDRDHLLGYEELAIGSNLFKADTDEDRLFDGDEIRFGTNPTLDDTDNDNVLDGDEIRLKTNPLKADSDEDGLSDGEELKFGANPLKPDTDDDKLNDGDEVTYGTNPLSKDSDGDGLDDYFEVSNYLNPTSSDTDSDWLSDGYEISLGINPRSNDTDKDGLSDYDEIMKYNTYAYKNDSDEDGVIDSKEIQLGLDPLNSDSDGDGLSDGYELKIGTNPEISWRGWFTEDTLKSALSDVYLREVANLAKQLDGKSYIDKVWNVLEWIDENVEYNYSKAKNTQNSIIQSPSRTVAIGSGICTDYTILTAALLLNLNISPVYVLDISYKNELSGHAAAAVKINGELFVLDQHLPPIHIGAYYYVSLMNGHIISNITVYKVVKTDVVKVKVLERYNGYQIKSMYREIKDEDLETIRKTISDRFKTVKSWFIEETKLKSIAESELECKIGGNCFEHKLPHGFVRGIVITAYKPVYYYHPIFSKKFADMIVQEFREADKRYSCYYFAVGKGSYAFKLSVEPAIVVVGCFAT